MKWVKNSSMLVARYLSSGSTGVTNNSHMFIIGLAARPQNTHHLGDGDSGRLSTATLSISSFSYVLDLQNCNLPAATATSR